MAHNYSVETKLGRLTVNDLPKIPGNHFEDITKQAHHRTQVFDFKNGYRKLRQDPCVPPPPMELMTSQYFETTNDTNNRVVHKSQEPPANETPVWVQLDKKVLRFFAYFKESVSESRVETYRVRKCIIYYYLEDDSIHVAEMKSENSGLPQGVFLSRHVIPKDSQETFTSADLNLGQNVTFYGRTYRITDCDAFTRQWFQENGRELGQSESIPGDPYTEQRALLKENVRTYQRPANDPKEKFLQNDGKVLRFYLYWDDRESLYGELRQYILHYFLADDTVEVREVHQANCGRDPFPLLMKRMALPKTLQALSGATTECVRHSDLRIGNTVDVFGRHMLICDADPFTTRWYKENYNMTDEDFKPIVMEKAAEYIPRMPIPPPNGFGSDADSISNFLSIVPKPPKQDFLKAMENDRKILRFVATFASEDPSKAEREFVISYFLADDTISVFEPPIRNSGMVGGKFLERGKVKNPASVIGECYTDKDFFVGATVKIYSHEFYIKDADEYTFAHMEGRPHVYPMSDINLVHKFLREKVESAKPTLYEAFMMVDKDRSGAIDAGEFRDVLKNAGIQISEQALVTLLRRYDRNRDGLIQYAEFVAALTKENVPDLLHSRDDAAHDIDMAAQRERSNQRITIAIEALKQQLQQKGSNLTNIIRQMTGDDATVTRSDLKRQLSFVGLSLQPEDWDTFLDSLSRTPRGEGKGTDKVTFDTLMKTLNGI